MIIYHKARAIDVSDVNTHCFHIKINASVVHIVMLIFPFES
jgi:hypothetical protein